jgi:opacity protein-like surface antigen
MRRFIIFLSVMVILFVANQTMAQGLGFKGVGGRISFVDPEAVSGTIGFGGHVNLGEIIANLALYPSFEYWNKSNVSDFSINADVRYYIPTGGNIDFFAGGGLAIQFVSVDLGPFGDASDTELGLDLIGGADFPVSDNLVATAKLKFLVSDLNVLKITGGLTYLIGK